MAQRGDSKRAQVSDLYRSLCNDCKIKSRCRDRNLHSREEIFGGGYPVECAEFQPDWFRGIEGVRP